MRHLYEEAMKYELPLEVGERGSCRIVRKTVTEEEASLGRMRAAFHPGGRYTPAGTYWGLLINGNLVMSDTPDERHDHLESVYRAKGHCLVNGLGLGMVAGIMLENPRVELVTVVEINENVIDLVEPHYSAKYGSHVEIVHCDALTYQPRRGSDMEPYGTISGETSVRTICPRCILFTDATVAGRIGRVPGAVPCARDIDNRLF